MVKIYIYITHFCVCAHVTQTKQCMDNHNHMTHTFWQKQWCDNWRHEDETGRKWRETQADSRDRTKHTLSLVFVWTKQTCLCMCMFFSTVHLFIGLCYWNHTKHNCKELFYNAQSKKRTKCNWLFNNEHNSYWKTVKFPLVCTCVIHV